MKKIIQHNNVYKWKYLWRYGNNLRNTNNEAWSRTIEELDAFFRFKRKSKEHFNKIHTMLNSFMFQNNIKGKKK